MVLALLKAIVQHDLSSGLMLQLGAVVITARPRFRRVIVALALLHTGEQSDVPSGRTIQLDFVIIAARFRLERVMFSDGAAMHGRTT